MRKLHIYLLLIISISLCACEKDYSYESLFAGVSGSWSFAENDKGFAGNINRAYIETSGSTHILHITGGSSAAENFQLTLYSSAAFKAGTYRTSAFEADFLYATGSQTVYHSNAFSGEFTVTINSITATDVNGTFQGIVEDGSAAIKTITAGQFSSKIN